MGVASDVLNTRIRHCDQSEAIQGREESLDCFAALAMTLSAEPQYRGKLAEFNVQSNRCRREAGIQPAPRCLPFVCTTGVGLTGTVQMSSAYSRIGRSGEKQGARATVA